MEYINKCGDMVRIKQNNYANYIALKSIFLNLHKKKSCPPLSADSFLLWQIGTIERPAQLSLSLKRLFARISRHEHNAIYTPKAIHIRTLEHLNRLNIVDADILQACLHTVAEDKHLRRATDAILRA